MSFFSSFEFWVLSFFCFGVINLFRSDQTKDFFLCLFNGLFLFFVLDFNFYFTTAYFCLAVCVWFMSWFVRYRIAFVALVLFLLWILGVSKYAWMQHVFNISSSLSLVGLSYFTFKVIHYAYEVNCGFITDRSLLNFMNFAFFFPSLLSGPLNRFQSFSRCPLEYAESLEAIFRISIGAVKKFVLSSIVMKYTVHLFSPKEILELSTRDLCLGFYAYTFLMYFDFSGYTDMAIGLGRLLGYRLPENFDWPFLSTSIQEFWSRWHITLSQWIRDFIFNPLLKFFLSCFPLGNTVLFSALAFLVSFVLSGVWHGDGLNFIIWGTLHGLAISSQIIYREIMRQRYRGFYQKLKNRFTYKVICWCLTFHFVVLSLVIFSLDKDRLWAVVKLLIG